MGRILGGTIGQIRGEQSGGNSMASSQSGTTSPLTQVQTHCAGIAAAIDNDRRVVGVAPGARLAKH